MPGMPIPAAGSAYSIAGDGAGWRSWARGWNHNLEISSALQCRPSQSVRAPPPHQRRHGRPNSKMPRLLTLRPLAMAMGLLLSLEQPRSCSSTGGPGQYPRAGPPSLQSGDIFTAPASQSEPAVAAWWQNLTAWRAQPSARLPFC